jgi:hypothetical protein
MVAHFGPVIPGGGTPWHQNLFNIGPIISVGLAIVRYPILIIL